MLLSLGENTKPIVGVLETLSVLAACVHHRRPDRLGDTGDGRVRRTSPGSPCFWSTLGAEIQLSLPASMLGPGCVRGSCYGRHDCTPHRWFWWSCVGHCLGALRTRPVRPPRLMRTGRGDTSLAGTGQCSYDRTRPRDRLSSAIFGCGSPRINHCGGRGRAHVVLLTVTGATVRAGGDHRQFNVFLCFGKQVY